MQKTQKTQKTQKIQDNKKESKEEMKRTKGEIKEKRENNTEFKMDDIVIGRNSVREVIDSKRSINRLIVQKDIFSKDIEEIIKIAKAKKIVIQFMKKEYLDKFSKNHQGIIANVSPFNYSSIDDILERAKEKNKQAFIIILDKIEDPHNLGAIIRSAEAAGVDGIIIPKRQGASINSTVSKVASGALENMLIARETNLVESIKYLKEKGLWIVSTEVSATQNYTKPDYTIPICIVIGNEEKGVSKLVSENCDIFVKIPMFGKVQSLNASVSAAILIYEVIRQRENK